MLKFSEINSHFNPIKLPGLTFFHTKYVRITSYLQYEFIFFQNFFILNKKLLHYLIKVKYAKCRSEHPTLQLFTTQNTVLNTPHYNYSLRNITLRVFYSIIIFKGLQNSVALHSHLICKNICLYIVEFV